MKSIKLAAVALALFGAALSAQAQAYVGGDLNTTSVDGWSDSTSFGVYAGYDFNTNLAAEVAYRKLGSFDSGPNTIKLNMTQVSAVVNLPLNDQFKVYGRLGYGFLNISGYDSYNVDDGIIYGAGAQFNVTKKVGIRGEFTRIASDATQVTFGVNYKF
jgi:opacity protein-like surface antigen